MGRSRRSKSRVDRKCVMDGGSKRRGLRKGEGEEWKGEEGGRRVNEIDQGKEEERRQGE